MAGADMVNVALLSFDDLLTELRIRSFTLFRWGPTEDPAMLAGVYRWSAERQADVLLLRPDQSATAYRAPVFDDRDIFAPQTVLWEYHCENALWTLRALLTLPVAGDRQAPQVMYPARGKCAVPGDLPSPVVFRPLGR
ncbi:hypothetical protein [Actinophytocola sediminis]